MDVPIGPVPHPGVAGGLHAANPEGRPSRSAWKVLARDRTQDVTLVEVSVLVMYGWRYCIYVYMYISILHIVTYLEEYYSLTAQLGAMHGQYF